jgi:colanic acid/amylovoran biosynthesis glycosyltransferase
MLRIAYLISRYPTISHTFILREIAELRRLGADIHTISVNPPDRPLEQLSEDERSEAATTLCLKTMRKAQIAGALWRTLNSRPAGLLAGLQLAFRLGGTDLKAVSMRLFYLAEAMLTGDFLRRQEIPHLHVHFATPAATVALFVKEVFGIPFSMTVHGPDEFYDVHSHHLPEKIAAASFLCTIGSFCRSQLMKLSAPEHWSKMEISPLGVDPQLFRPREIRPIRSGSRFRILCLGRLVTAKGQAVLLDAVRILARRGQPVLATFAGDGPDRQRLETMAREYGVDKQVTFLGGVNPDTVRDLYAACDAFVLPSFAEGIPVVLMEAMAMEVPCVTTVINGIPELITSGESGLLVSPSDAVQLADAIQTLIDDAPRRQALGKAGRRKVIASYNLTRNVAHLHSIFRRRLGAGEEVRWAA